MIKTMIKGAGIFMSLAVLVSRFGDLLIEQSPPPIGEEAAPYEDFAADLTRIRNALNHHLIPLLALARCDGDFAMAEREAILTYCLAHLNDLDMAATPDERAALDSYLREFRPARAQLAAALKRLERESEARIAALIAAAQAVVDADGVRRAYEVKILSEIADELAVIQRKTANP
jgi:uncharacterized tellurite resistance protein B-like protein